MRQLQEGDVIVVTQMKGWVFRGPLYALALEPVSSKDDPDYHMLLIVEGGYSPKREGEFFHIGSRAHVSRRQNIQWDFVDDPPDRVLVKIARWRLTGEIL